VEESGVISAYVDRLAGQLAFDRALSRDVRREVEDHLWEAVAGDSTRVAQQRAVANFGDAHAIAAQFAAVALARRTRRVGLAALLVIAGVFIAMQARFAWYGVPQGALSDELRAFRSLVVSIERWAFWLSVIIGFAGWGYIRSRYVPQILHPAYRRQLRRFRVLCSTAAAALGVSVLCDGILIGHRLLAMEPPSAFLVAVASMAIEVACAGILVFQIRGIMRRTASTAALLET
jgi:hypothetical protein